MNTNILALKLSLKYISTEMKCFIEYIISDNNTF